MGSLRSSGDSIEGYTGMHGLIVVSMFRKSSVATVVVINAWVDRRGFLQRCVGGLVSFAALYLQMVSHYYGVGSITAFGWLPVFSCNGVLLGLNSSMEFIVVWLAACGWLPVVACSGVLCFRCTASNESENTELVGDCQAMEKFVRDRGLASRDIEETFLTKQSMSGLEYTFNRFVGNRFVAKSRSGRRRSGRELAHVSA
ncbi:hypothetical protein DY000_02017777 [Brassica cretica]|uniref:Major facilitator superfamily (MFS) profile domain-containing protein n=1 Tax=Brassica cretica TaxID=69181 RepID=A0ABQ7CW90_BRACR|nr:hypothetical protein DY000_02017777 [Brassica cretica]